MKTSITAHCWGWVVCMVVVINKHFGRWKRWWWW